MFNIWDESCWKQSKVGVLSFAVGEGDDNYDGQAKKKSLANGARIWKTHPSLLSTAEISANLRL